VRAQAPARLSRGEQGGGADRPSRSWSRLTSEHFVAVGDAPERVIRQGLQELELFRLHEYAHDVIHFNLPGWLPPWLNEGLAQLYASVAMC
jgi:hypothetical protein